MVIIYSMENGETIDIITKRNAFAAVKKKKDI